MKVLNTFIMGLLLNTVFVKYILAHEEVSREYNANPSCLFS